MKKSILLLTLFIASTHIFCQEYRDIIEDMSVYEYCKAESVQIFFRATAVVKHRDEGMSLMIATQKAKAQMAHGIKQDIKSKTKMYEETQEIGDSIAWKSISETMITLSSEVSLSDVKVICNQVIRLENGLYQRSVSVEMPKENVLKDLEKHISKENSLYKKFKKDQF